MPELIVVLKPGVSADVLPSAPDADDGTFPLAALTRHARSEGATLRPLFGVSPSRLRVEAFAAPSATADVPDLSVYYRVDLPSDRVAGSPDASAGRSPAVASAAGALDRLEALAETFRGLTDLVEGAYVKPDAELPARLNDMAPAPQDAPPVTPDFVSRQGYLEAAPGGVEARHAWTLPGGTGAGVRIVDIEGAWRFGHEDLLQNQGGVIGGTQSPDLGWRNHGTAVVGVFGADRNPFGVTGISPDANVRAVSIFGSGMGSAAAIRAAANALRAGDIILIELHRPGPRHNFAGRNDQRGYIAIEWWPDDYDAIRYATGRGVIVVEAAGNGAENLDDAIYDTRGPGFPASWSNPFRRGARDCGAVLVGAGAPPPGTHGRNHGADRSRLDFSNYGASVDAQGWGREVTTTGYGDLQGGANEDLWYTDSFSGTSSASPVVVGSLACVQGVLRARGATLLTPASARRCLRSTGSAQQDEPGRPSSQRIGTRPNIRQLLQCALPKTTKEAKEKREVKELKERQKELKDQIKEVKEKREVKEVKEVKEGKEFQKELKEFQKDGKEFQKETKDFKDMREKGLLEGHPAATPDLEARVEQLEQALAHFIPSALRPDLAASALSNEEDLQGDLARQEAQGKCAKDLKDSETPCGG